MPEPSDSVYRAISGRATAEAIVARDVGVTHHDRQMRPRDRTAAATAQEMCNNHGVRPIGRRLFPRPVATVR